MLSRIIETSDDWVRERSGIVTRYYVEPGVGSSDLGAEAARAALADAGIGAGRGGLPGLRHHDPGPLLPRHRHPDPAEARHAAAAGARHPPAVRRLRLRPAGGGRADPGRRRAHGAAGRRRRPHLPDAVLGAHLRGAARRAIPVRSRRRTSSGTRASAISSCCSATAPARWSSGPRRRTTGAASSPRPSMATATTGTSSTSPAAARRAARSSACEMIQAAETVPVMDGKAVFKLAVTRMPEVTRRSPALRLHHEGSRPPDHAPGQPAHQREGAAGPGAAGRARSTTTSRSTATPPPPPCRSPSTRPARRASSRGGLVAFAALGAGLHWGSVLMRV